MNKAVIGLSGGMDSATLLGYLLSQGHEVHCCSFKYGSKHNPYENESAIKIARFYEDRSLPSVHLHRYDLTPILGNLDSALIENDEEVPEGHFADEIMKRTVVPGRNLLFASVMASLAESVGAQKIGLGVHSGDHPIYPDCRTEFVKALDSTVFLSTDGQVEVIAPFRKFDKIGILEVGYNLSPEVPYHLTRTCYKAQEVACGKCGSCQERLEAFEKIGREDPVKYE